MSSAPLPDVAYKILTREQLDTLLADGTFGGAPIDIADGYIHMSSAGQVRETLEKHFAGQDDVHLAAVDLRALEAAIRWEVSRGGALFPHLYADLPLAAVIAHAPVAWNEDGSLALPG
ncbi:DUF952 domain-containing protein [Novosphingobium sp. YJ-S2-02]|uniref:DUF952 domain-containing protein n=1 Tax=Novosphingobium aureum TaxID=2792964 RepID=A0A931MKX5_9SPHN|nr:DUF952 domain-containing protein [Novosphingobium aureum]MBH0113392.1 DUF952 domain-containing protein [Novosphingobium aureum]